MSKHSRAKKARSKRRWYKNVGDPIDLRKTGADNPNDMVKK